MGRLTEKTRAEIDEMAADLQQLRDEIRLKLHLANMEVKKGFQQMEPRVRELEQKTTEVTEEELDKLKLSMKRAKEKLLELRNRVIA